MKSFTLLMPHSLTHSLPHTLTLPLSRAYTSKEKRKREEEESLFATHQRMSSHSLFEIFIYSLKCHGHPSLFNMIDCCGKVLFPFSFHLALFLKPMPVYPLQIAQEGASRSFTITFGAPLHLKLHLCLLP